MLIFWVSIALVHAENMRLKSAEVATDKERKRELVAKWRKMLLRVATRPVMTTFGANLRIQEEFMSLESHLPEQVIQALDDQSAIENFPGQVLRTKALQDLKAEIFRL